MAISRPIQCQPLLEFVLPPAGDALLLENPTGALVSASDGLDGTTEKPGFSNDSQLYAVEAPVSAQAVTDQEYKQMLEEFAQATAPKTADNRSEVDLTPLEILTEGTFCNIYSLVKCWSDDVNESDEPVDPRDSGLQRELQQHLSSLCQRMCKCASSIISAEALKGDITPGMLLLEERIFGATRHGRWEDNDDVNPSSAEKPVVWGVTDAARVLRGGMACLTLMITWLVKKTRLQLETKRKTEGSECKTLKRSRSESRGKSKDDRAKNIGGTEDECRGLEILLQGIERLTEVKGAELAALEQQQVLLLQVLLDILSIHSYESNDCLSSTWISRLHTSAKKALDPLLRQISHQVSEDMREAQMKRKGSTNLGAYRCSNDGGESTELEEQGNSGENGEELCMNRNEDNSQGVNEKKPKEPPLWQTSLYGAVLSPAIAHLIQLLALPGLRGGPLPVIILREGIQRIQEQALLGAMSACCTLTQRDAFVAAGDFLEFTASLLPRVWLLHEEAVTQLFAADQYVIRKSLLECLKSLLLQAQAIVDAGKEENLEDVKLFSQMDMKEYGTAGGVVADGEGEDADIRAGVKRGGKITVKPEEDPVEEKCWECASKEDVCDRRVKETADSRRFWAKRRRSLLMCLLQRLEDKLPLARCWALKVIGELLEKNALPTVGVLDAVTAAAARIQDRSTMVRAAALQVVGAMLQLAVQQQLQQQLLHPLVLLLVDDDGQIVMFQKQEQRQAQQGVSARNAQQRSIGDCDGTEKCKGKNDDGGCQPNDLSTSTDEVEANNQDEKVIAWNMAYKAEIILNEALERAQYLLFSKAESDRKAALRLIADGCCLLQLRRGHLLQPLQYALRLGFSRSASVAEAAVSEFERLFLDPQALAAQQQLLLQQRSIAEQVRISGLLPAVESPPQQKSNNKEIHLLHSMLVAAATNGSGVYRQAALRLLEFALGADMAVLVSLEKLFFLCLQRDSSSTAKGLRHLIQALFVVALQPNFEMSRDLCPRAALRIIRLIFGASRRQAEDALLRGLTSARGLADGKLLHRLSDQQLRAVVGVIRQQAQRQKVMGFVVFAEACHVLSVAAADRRTAKAATVAVSLLLDRIYDTDPYWFSAAQAVVDLSFEHLPEASDMWMITLQRLLKEFLGKPVTERSFVSEFSQERYGATGDNTLSINKACNNFSDAKQRSSGHPSYMSVELLARILMVSGHVAMRCCAQLEDLNVSLKKARTAGRVSFGDDACRDDTGSANPNGSLAYNSSKRTGSIETKEGKSALGIANAEASMGMQTKEEEESEYLSHIIEHQIVCKGFFGGPIRRLCLIAAFEPHTLLMNTSTAQERQSDCLGEGFEGISGARSFLNGDIPCELVCFEALSGPVKCIQAVAVLTLCKFSCISKSFCLSKVNGGVTTLHALFSLLFQECNSTSGEIRVSSAIRKMLLVAFGDLTCRHPNLLERYNRDIFNILLDSDLEVQLTALHVCTHLVMGGIIKPKGSLLVLLLVLLRSPDRQIREGARTFFYELERKEASAVMNALPELLVALGMTTSTQFEYSNETDDQEQFLNFLLQFLSPGRHCEGLIDKLCQRISLLHAQAGADNSVERKKAFMQLDASQAVSKSDEHPSALPLARNDMNGFEQNGYEPVESLSHCAVEKLIRVQNASPEKIKCCRRVLIKALSAAAQKSTNPAKLLTKLIEGWHKLKFAVMEDEGDVDILKDMVKKILFRHTRRGFDRAAKNSNNDSNASGVLDGSAVKALAEEFMICLNASSNQIENEDGVNEREMNGDVVGDSATDQANQQFDAEAGKLATDVLKNDNKMEKIQKNRSKSLMGSGKTNLKTSTVKSNATGSRSSTRQRRN